MPDLLKGPYLQWPTTDGVTVMWETAECGVGEVEWFETESVHSGLSGAARTIEASRSMVEEDKPRRIHRVRIDGL